MRWISVGLLAASGILTAVAPDEPLRSPAGALLIVLLLGALLTYAFRPRRHR